MSRCFPFPPPGYKRSGACSEALIESIKLQTEMENAKKERKKEKKEKKREKKEKKKEKKERKQKEGTVSHASDGKEFKLIDELEKTRAGGILQKGDDYENEQLERSGITEEHDQPVTSRELCCLSDSTQSSKRKRSTSPSSPQHGTAIRIRFPLRKHREHEETKLEDQLGSTSGSAGIADSFSQETRRSDHQLQCVTNADTDQSLGNSDSRHCNELQNLVHGAALVTNVRDDESRRMASVYNSLFQNLLPPPLTCDVFNSEDVDWLFRSELTEPRPVSKKLKSLTDAFRCSTPSLWPRAQYLPEAEIYALPYTVPF